MRAFVFSTKSTFSWVLFLCLWSSNHAQQSKCFNDQNQPIYFPCYCHETKEGNLNITCLEEFVSYQQIQIIFQDSTALEINNFALIPVSDPSNQINIIDNLLADKRARVIEIASCPLGSTLKISTNAFRASNTYAQEFSITDCDIDQLNWAFLRSFVQITNIRLTSVTGINSFGSLPRLRNAGQLSFIDCSGFDNTILDFPGASLPALKTLVLDGTTDLSNEAADNIMLSLASNGVLLNDLTIRRSMLITLVPGSLGNIVTLNSIDLSNNNIELVSSTAFNFPNDLSVRLIDLSNNAVNSISFNAFSRGNYGGATILLDKNMLTDFEWEVFLEVLGEMNDASSGLVSIADNAIICSECNLAWLIRDNPDLKQWVSGGTCSSGTTFEELDPNDYGSVCSVITPRPTTTSSTEPPTTEVPTTEVPTTEVPTTEVPTTEVPTTEIPTTEAPTTASPTTEIPTTEIPTTEIPTTEIPTTEIPTTEIPTTEIPTTEIPTTEIRTNAPTTKTTTEAISTTSQPNNNNTDNSQLLLYITCGLVALILLVLIIGCIYMVYTKNARKNRRESFTSVRSNSFSVRSRSSAIPVNNTLSGLPRSYVGPPPSKPATLPRANIPPVVQGPGGKLYIQSSGVPNTNAANTTKVNKQQTQGKSTTRQGY